MNQAEDKTCNTIEQTLDGHKAFRKVEEGLYVVKQGSSYVMINVVPWEDRHAVVRCVAQVVKGVEMTPNLALELLSFNAHLRFGAFAYVEQGSVILFSHSILGGETLDSDELLETIRDVALVSDEWDDKIIERHGGQRMQDLLEEAVFASRTADGPDDFEWSE